MYRKIAEKLYKLFVVNSYAAAIQQKDGRYITKYFPLSEMVIEEMLKQNGSMGCYQQGYKTGRIKWICFDFDCSDKENPDVMKLYDLGVHPFTEILDRLSIEYLTEFSGRRGIHVWIIFDTIFPKKIGYQIIQKLKVIAKDVIENPFVQIDFFPATDSSRGNVVGKQVKLPLSFHQRGKRSYLFQGEYRFLLDCSSDKFLENQYEILDSYILNKLEKVEKILDIDESKCHREYKYKKYRITEKVEVTLEQIEKILSEVQVYRNIFCRMKQGQARREDWSVLLGTLGYLGNDCQLVKELFSTFPNYDVEKTIKNIESLKERYFPATFSYLYQIYQLEPESWLDKSETGLAYLLRALGCEDSMVEQIEELNEHQNTAEMKYTLLKEKTYLLDNDEIPDVLIWNRLNAMKQYDLMQLEQKANKIRNGEWEEYTVPQELLVYDRLESEEKKRRMVSLSAEDRVLTTHLILMLSSKLQSNMHSFSYNISSCSQNHIFYSWYSSWKNYISKVETFLEIPFFESFQVFVVDLRGFYDHIDFLAVYKALERKLDEEEKNILQYLIAYNEKVMWQVNENSRYGVPQGPAYARVIAEIFLDYILQSIFKRYDRKKFHFYRYVDDMVFYYQPDFDGEKLYCDLENTLLSFGLPLNQEKSRFLGSVGHLTKEEKILISHSDKFSYDLHMDESDVIFEEEQNQRLDKYMQEQDFDISVVSYIFGNHVFPRAKVKCYEKYADQIFSEIYGRGSYFRKFYQYLYQNEELLEQAIITRKFFKIPINSLNFSNMIHCLYLAVQKEIINKKLFVRLKKEYLFEIRDCLENERDASVLEALLVIEE